jgi:hypothetical protein
VIEVQANIDPAQVLGYDGLQPALCLPAIRRVARVTGQWAAEILQIQNELPQRQFRSSVQLLPETVHVKIDVTVFPSRKGQPAKTKHYFTGLRRGMSGDRVGRKGDDGGEIICGAVEQELRFSPGHQPG